MTAHIIRSEDEALAVARRLAAEFAEGASARDRERRLPHDEVRRYAQSGLWGIGIPREHGGIAASYQTIIEVMATVSTGDSSIGQLPQNNFLLLDSLNLIGSDVQKRFFFAEAL